MTANAAAHPIAAEPQVPKNPRIQPPRRPGIMTLPRIPAQCIQCTGAATMSTAPPTMKLASEPDSTRTLVAGALSIKSILAILIQERFRLCCPPGARATRTLQARCFSFLLRTHLPASRHSPAKHHNDMLASSAAASVSSLACRQAISTGRDSYSLAGKLTRRDSFRNSLPASAARGGRLVKCLPASQSGRNSVYNSLPASQSGRDSASSALPASNQDPRGSATADLKLARALSFRLG
jgi:hypothetical protein